jgi:hypothetical protein
MSPGELEFALERLSAQLASADPPRWGPSARRIVAAAFAAPALRAQALALLQRHAPAWIEDAPLASMARVTQGPPTWADVRRRRLDLELIARAHFATSWSEVVRWHCGAPEAALPAPQPIPAAAAEWSHAGARWSFATVATAIIPPSLGEVTVSFSKRRPRTLVVGAGAKLELSDDSGSARSWFQLLHELGHALAGLTLRRPLPRAVDEAVAAWLARHLEEPNSVAGLPSAAWAAPALHRAERERRAKVAGALAHLEAAIPTAAQATSAAAVPWALWHDPGVQVAYLHAEALAEAWWTQGLRAGALDEVAAALARACDQAAALPPPFSEVVA